jgi:virginiamycin B lyase
MWFTQETAGSIGRIAMDGTVTEYPVPTEASGPWAIALGPDGAMWFTEQWAGQIGRIAMDGSVTEYPLPALLRSPTGIALGPDGAMWFTGRAWSRIGRIAADGQVTEFALPGGRLPTAIAPGPDGAMWFTAPGSNSIGRITTAGSVTEFAIPTPSSLPAGITLGPDGAMWFTEQGGNRLARIGADGTIVEHPLPTDWSGPSGVAGGPDGNVWFTESSVSAIGRLQLVQPDTTPPAVTIVAPAEGAAYLVGQVALADFVCADEGGSGLASCAGTVDDGVPLDTSTPGIRRLSVTATDGAGNVVTQTRSYIVFASWDGRLALPPGIATLRAGQPADLRFDLGGDLGAVLEPGAPFMLPVDCGGQVALGPVGPAPALGQGLMMTGSRYTFRWRTEKAWAGTCRQLVLPFAIEGGTVVRLTVRFA